MNIYVNSFYSNPVENYVHILQIIIAQKYSIFLQCVLDMSNFERQCSMSMLRNEPRMAYTLLWGHIFLLSLLKNIYPFNCVCPQNQSIRCQFSHIFHNECIFHRECIVNKNLKTAENTYRTTKKITQILSISSNLSFQQQTNFLSIYIRYIFHDATWSYCYLHCIVCHT